jgi:hypothetical protein
VVRTVFKIAEVVARRLVGSIPTRSRQNTLILRTILIGNVMAVAKRLQTHLCEEVVEKGKVESTLGRRAAKRENACSVAQTRPASS